MINDLCFAGKGKWTYGSPIGEFSVREDGEEFYTTIKVHYPFGDLDFDFCFNENMTPDEVSWHLDNFSDLTDGYSFDVI